MAKRKSKTAASSKNSSHDNSRKSDMGSLPLHLLEDDARNNNNNNNNNKNNNKKKNKNDDNKHSHPTASPSLDVLHPNAVFVCRRFFTPRECQAWIDHVEKSGELHHMNSPGTRYMAQRECSRWQRHDTDMAKRLFARIQRRIIPKLPALDFPDHYQPVSCNPKLRFYKYEKGMTFGKHYDDSETLQDGNKTEMTILIYLSDCIGGATRFYPATSTSYESSVAFTPEQGAMLVHIHGDRCLLHEAEAVEQGVKYVLRTDLVYARV